MKIVKDLTGKKFNMLTVIKMAERKEGEEIKWVCRCDCGNVLEVHGGNLKKGHTKSCGCYSEKIKSERRKDLTGKRFGKLTVVKYIPPSERKEKRKQYLCKCDCGNDFYARGDSLRAGTNLSCGCYKEDRYRDGHSKTHGMSHEKIYAIWCSMKARCYNPNNQGYTNYGGRGITVCKEWRNSFENFRDWAIANGYKEGLSIDRINVNGNYEPSNCQWITVSEQSDNKRGSRKITYKGKEYTARQLSKKFNIPYTTIYNNVIRRGKEIEDFLNNYTA